MGDQRGIATVHKELVRAAYYQNKGICRHMKIGMEGIAGTIAALDAWDKRDHKSAHDREQTYVKYWLKGLSNVDEVVFVRNGKIDRLIHVDARGCIT